MPAEVRNTLAFGRQTTLHTAHRVMHAGFEEVAKALWSERSEGASLLREVLDRSHVHIAVEAGSLKLLPPPHKTESRPPQQPRRSRKDTTSHRDGNG